MLAWAIALALATFLGYLLGKRAHSAERPPQPQADAATPATAADLEVARKTQVNDILRRRDAKSAGRRRLLIVAKDLPVRSWRDGEDFRAEWQDARSFLANLRVLQGSSATEVKWVGLPGMCVPRQEQPDYETAVDRHDCVPVFISEELNARFNMFCSSVLSPLLHYSIKNINDQWDDLWQAYQSVNNLFAKEVSRLCESAQDTIWIHNYELLLMPSFLRKKLPRAKIGIFLHTPFPSSDIFRVLPSRENLLRAMMCADIIGFHTFDYARHFLSCCKRVLDLDYEALPGGLMAIKCAGRHVSIFVNHVGIQANVFGVLSRSPGVVETSARVRSEHSGRRIILAVDQSDRLSGAALKLQAFARLLENEPELAESVVMIELLLRSEALTTEEEQARYQLASEGKRLTERFGPGVFQWVERDRDMDLAHLIALYQSAHVAIVSTLWDGLNLIPLELTASQDPDDPCALLVSEFMGCARSIQAGIVNPWAVDRTAEVLRNALNMPPEERKAHHARRLQYVTAHNVENWAHRYLSALDQSSKLGEDLVYAQVGWGSNVRLVGLRSDFVHVDESSAGRAYRTVPGLRFLFLDYDGTLTAADKDDAPRLRHLASPKTRKVLKALTDDPRNIVFLITGRRRAALVEMFGDLPELGLAAEKGCFLRWPASRRDLLYPASLRRKTSFTHFEYKEPGTPLAHDERIVNEEWESLTPDLDEQSSNWKEVALEVIRAYTEHTDGSWIEDKEFSLVWHYANADPEYGRMQASELTKFLAKVLPAAIDVVKYDYSRVVEVKPHGVSKGITVTHILRTVLKTAHRAADAFIPPPEARSPLLICMGDDRSDEDMFTALHKRNFLKPIDAVKPKKPHPKERTPAEEKERRAREKRFDPNCFTLCVGIKPSSARYFLHDHDDALRFLNNLASMDRSSSSSASGSFTSSARARLPAAHAQAQAQGLTTSASLPSEPASPLRPPLPPHPVIAPGSAPPHAAAAAGPGAAPYAVPRSPHPPPQLSLLGTTAAFPRSDTASSSLGSPGSLDHSDSDSDDDGSHVEARISSMARSKSGLSRLSQISGLSTSYTASPRARAGSSAAAADALPVLGLRPRKGVEG